MQWTNEDGTMALCMWNQDTGLYDKDIVAQMDPPELDPNTIPDLLDTYLTSGKFMQHVLDCHNTYYECRCHDAPCTCWTLLPKEAWLRPLTEIGADVFFLYVEDESRGIEHAFPTLFLILCREALERTLPGAPPA